ncbi:hypothetical protein CFO_g661 [Ceratocystis platani]|uniref:Uncharacterized protein n=1 Tax=Ceratocystis fimbriata f. sp. platani TaxID=88771 RepID=A0A0F8B4X3_CERFI|nr:hypothetical protein CFO_g661 [Ceratocystis platani]
MNVATNIDVDLSPKSFNAQEVGRFSNSPKHGDFGSGVDVVVVFGNTNSLFSRPEDNIGITNGQNGMSDARYTLVRKDDAFAGVPRKCPPDTLMCEFGDEAISRDLPLLILDDKDFEYIAKGFAFSPPLMES